MPGDAERSPYDTSEHVPSVAELKRGKVKDGDNRHQRLGCGEATQWSHKEFITAPSSWLEGSTQRYAAREFMGSERTSFVSENHIVATFDYPLFFIIAASGC